MYAKLQEPIAIIGSGCHLAGDVNSTSQLWELLREPRDVRSVISDDRFNPDGWYHPDGSYHGHCNVKQAYLISRNLRQFDTEFFNIKPLEARSLDPQQMLLLETVYEAVEAAGLSLDSLNGSDTGVYAGVMFRDIEASLLRDTQSIPTYMATGSSNSMISNRVSYYFGWQGPSITVDTACSSSLVAVHLAVQALRAGDCQMAVACGANLLLGPENYVTMSKLKMLSPDSLSKMWDRDANGYARGDGVSAVVLKTLTKALADGDNIECIIRETGVNQDGATSDGLTLPSSSAQKALIRSVYSKAGLNPLKHEDQPQYFEAHGTGTPAGDPIEAAGMYGAFFEDCNDRIPSQDPMYVGSLKTVLGHTEGSAGIASILKASLALRHTCIPPNLHFNNLSKSVAPYYNKFEISKILKPWPQIYKDSPRRASVNSFGIGGTNAHAILESYDDVLDTSSSAFRDDTLFTPFVFSAGSGQSLRKILSAYSAFLDTHSTLSSRNFAWTLRKRRSVLQYRVAFTAESIKHLKSKISERLSQPDPDIGVRVPSSGEKKASILGVFTGQGAQYARMGAELIEKSTAARKIIQQLELYLAELPETDRPTWSLEAELLADTSSIHSSNISQPICTAIQILITDLLQAANISFSAVVGHSSGEIGAAYAAGYITARDAICIAYYRGIHLESACSPRGEHIKGVMLAAAISMEDAVSLCNEDTFVNRISIAASNSPSSITISGDEDAIAELQNILKEQQKFNRLLRVNRAYHSSHMVPCLKGYTESLASCGIKPLRPSTHSCVWYSSVYNRPIDRESELEGPYWAENLRKPVLFSHAVKAAVAESSFDIVLEIGPHPALQGPTRQTIQDVLTKNIPYHGTLTRGVSAVESMSDVLGFLWMRLNPSSLDLDKFERFMTLNKCSFRLLKDLPAYQWNHDVAYCNESRISRRMRTRKPVHPLLGDMCVDTGSHQLSWRNVLRESEIDWLQDHQVQGQTIFPAAGYVSTALEASKFIVEERNIQLVELRNFYIHQAIDFDQSDNGVEVLISLTNITRARPGCVRAKFTYSAGLGATADELTLAASADVEITEGDPSPDLLPKRGSVPPHMVDVKPELFYRVMDGLGLQFRRRFASLHSITRKNGRSSCCVRMRPQEEASYGKPLSVHPAELDSAFQSVFLARGYPGDEQLPCLYLPQSCSLVRVNMLVCQSMANKDGFASVDATVEMPNSDAKGFSADINIYPSDKEHAAIQVQGVVLKPLRQISDEDDRKVFYETRWVDSGPDGLSAASGITVGKHHKDILSTLVRIAAFYLKELVRGVPRDDLAMPPNPNNYYLQYARHVTTLLDKGKNKWVQKEWSNDTLDDIIEAGKTLPEIPEVPLMHIVGQKISRAFKGEVNMSEELRICGFLDEYYVNGFGLRESALWIGRVVGQITGRYPHMNILEIGAGTGAATKSILRAVGRDFLSYTSTDVSVSFAETAKAVFSKHQHQGRMIFKVLDAENDPVEQGYTEGGYDLIVASSVLHATAELEETLRNIRKLLRPGGFLVVAEGSNDIQPGGIPGFIFGSLPEWWLGVPEGRTFSPFISDDDWDKRLKATGFSGIDETAPEEFQNVLGMTLFVSRAVDSHVDYLRAPRSTLSLDTSISSLFIIGGETERTAHLAEELCQISRSLAIEPHIFKTLRDVEHGAIHPSSIVVCLTDLDKPVFQDITPEQFLSLKKIFGTPKTMLWITAGRRGKKPFFNMTVGFGRTAMNETPGLRLQFLDTEAPWTIHAQQIIDFILRLHTTSRNGHNTLWTIEPEIVIDSKGRELLPRLRYIPALNDRYNSTRREITHEVNTSDTTISIQWEKTGWTAKQLLEQPSVGETVPLVEINTTHAIISAIKTPSGYKFLTLGFEVVSKAKYLALVPSLASTLRIPSSSVIRCPDTQRSDSSLLVLVASHLVASAVLDPLWDNHAVVVHNPSIVVAEAIAMKASEENISVVFMTDSSEQGTPSSWITLCPYISRSALKKVLPSTISCFVGLTNRDGKGSDNQSTIISCLSPHCRNETQDTIFSFHGSEGFANSPVLGRALQQALDSITRHEDQKSDTLAAKVVSITDLIRKAYHIDPMTVVDWTIPAMVPVPVTRLDVNSFFKADKTYWIVGLSGNLGTSLCDWMISKGAKTIALTSRNPQIKSDWISAHSCNGVTIAILPGDVTDEASLKAVKEKITVTLPPIAGVMNGAAMLKDVSIKNMSFKQLDDVIGPKVYGSMYLDRLFKYENLDFFLLFSSVSWVYGNLGQANYAAANAYVCTLAAQRRQRGLAATAIDIGPIFGVGYMERAHSKALDLTVSKMSLMHLSEVDFHQIIAESIIYGRPGALGGPELSTGLVPVAADSPDAPIWCSNPRFAAFITHRTEDGRSNGVAAASPSISGLLEQCKTEDDVEGVVKSTLAAQLRRVLELTTADEDLMSMRTKEIGVDSLISADLRAWILKWFEVSVPVLKIIGNDTVASLAEHVSESIPAALVPHARKAG
ncbi:uncharacterized protein F4812DRAFT_454916 [Daldinia caldariorum]|uniref:uncharacterized protein n=1 Tax=Daldinia caldariorum TaxID=326644 RepID=UPI002008C98B|nr:uncharacterized protein F4812DRAFT_454916 [Daldinia caldariorum]KAI1473097.1 hypothetical protein F4812DRAFT_454916 [Daldinia caldariorum]